MLAAVTDSDAWHEAEEAVDATTVMTRLAENVEVSRKAVAKLTAALDDEACDCGTALDAGLVTPPRAIPGEARERLAPILGRRLGAEDA